MHHIYFVLLLLFYLCLFVRTLCLLFFMENLRKSPKLKHPHTIDGVFSIMLYNALFLINGCFLNGCSQSCTAKKLNTGSMFNLCMTFLNI